VIVVTRRVGTHKLKHVTQPRDSGSTTVFNIEELLIPRRLQRLLKLLLQPLTWTNSTSACCPNSPICVTACGDWITYVSCYIFNA